MDLSVLKFRHLCSMVFKKTIYFIALVLAFNFLWSCGGPMQIRDGNTAFELKKYALASELYAEEYENARMNEQRAEKAFLLAESFSRMGEYHNATRWYQRAGELGYGLPAREAMAHHFMKLEQYDRAATAFEELLRDFGSLDEWENAAEISRLASRWLDEAEERPYRIEKSEFNSPDSDYAPAFYSSDIIVFSSDRPDPDRLEARYSWTGRGFFNYLSYDLERGLFTDDFDFLNSDYNEGTLSFTGDQNKLFFTRCKGENSQTGFCRILFTEKTEGQWSAPEELPFQLEDANYAHPAVDTDGNTLVFSYKPPNHTEGYDLYITYKRGPEWVEPRRLPGSVNTRGNEVFPFLMKDTLYFSSDGHPGMGGLDIFKAVRQEDGNWGRVENLKPPFNSGADDFGWVADRHFEGDGDLLQRGFFSSSREEATDHIYYFEKFFKETEEPEVAVEYTVRLRGTVFEQLFEDPSDPNSRRLGVRNLPNARVEIIDSGDTTIIQTRRDAVFEKEVEYGKEYTVAASADGFLRKSMRVSTADLEKNPERPRKIVPVDLTLDRLVYDKEVVMDDIYYDFDRWEIREDAKPTLNELVALMEDNPGLRIELGSHTDCRGTEAYNIELSQNRAQSAVDYLVDSGISRDRLMARGYGKSRLRVDCICEECTEEEHQLNRRTTFRIIENGN